MSTRSNEKLPQAPSRLARGLKRALKVVAVGLGAIMVLVALALASLNLAPVRAKIALEVSHLLSKVLSGQFEITALGQVGIAGIGGLDVRVRDDAGKPVVELTDAHARIDTPRLIRSLFKGPLQIRISEVQAKTVTVRLEDGLTEAGTTTLAIAQVFIPRPTPGEPSTPDSEKAPPPVVVIENIRAQTIVATRSSPDGPLQVSLENVNALFRMDGVPLIQAKSSDVTVRVPQLAEPYRGAIDFTGLLPEAQEPLLLRAQLKGTLGAVRVDVDGILRNQDWTGDVQLEGTKEALGQLKLGFAPNGALKADVQVSGNFEAARASLSARLGTTALDGIFSIVFNGPSLKLTASSAAIDPRDIEASLPSMKIPTTLTASVDFSRWAAELDVVTDSFIYNKRRVEAMQLLGFAHPKQGRLSLTSLASSKVYAALSFDARDDQSLRVRATLDWAHPPDILAPFLPVAGLSRLNGLKSALAVDYASRTQLASGKLDLSVASIAGVGNAFTVDSASINSAFELNERRQYVKLEATAQEVTAGDMSVRDPVVYATGNLARISVRVGAEGQLRGQPYRATLGGVLSIAKKRLDALALEFERAGEHLTANVASVVLEPELKATGIRISGVGDVTGQFALKGNEPQLTMSGTDVNLKKVSRLLVPLVPPLEGLLRFEVAMSSLHPLNGSVDLEGKNLAFQGQRLAGIQLHIASKTDKLTANAAAQTPGDLSSLSVQVDEVNAAELLALTQAGKLQPPRRGKLQVKLDANLSEASSFLAQAEAPLTLVGRAAAEVNVDFMGQATEVKAQLGVSGVSITTLNPSRDTESVRTSAVASTMDLSRLLANIDVAYSWGNQDLALFVALDERRSGQVVPVATFNLSTRVPRAVLTAEDVGSLRDEKLSAQFDLQRFKLGDLPAAWMPPGFTGRVSATAEAAGTWGDPSIELLANGENLMSPAFSACAELNVAVQGKYDKGDATVKVEATREARPMATIEAKAQATSLLSMAEPLSYELSLATEQLSLTCVPYLVDYGVEGTVSANLVASGSVRDAAGPRLKAHIESRSLMLADVPFRLVEVNADLNKGALTGSARIVQSDGQLDANVKAKALLTRNDQTVAFERAQLTARNFEIAPAELFLRGIASDLKGKLNGAITLHPTDAGLFAKGRLTLSQGTVNVIPLGQQLDDIKVDVRSAQPGLFRISTIHADSLDGELDGSGTISYDKAGLTALDAAMRIPRTRPVPVFYQGVRMGEVKGEIKLLGRREKDGFKLELFAPELDAYLSEEDMTVQSLAPADNIRVGTFMSGGRFVELGKKPPREPAPTKDGEKEPEVPAPSLKVALGNNVWIHRGQGVAAAIEGGLELGGGSAKDAQGLAGELKITQGQIDVVGRMFEVRFGTVTFRGEDPPDPVIVAEAVWDAPSGHLIIARFTGPASSGELELSSEPALSESEILNVVLFEDPEGELGGASGGGGADVGTRAASTVAFAGFGRALSDLSTLDIQASVETNDESSTKTELQVRVNPRVTAKIAYNTGASAVSRTPDSTLVSLGLRLSKRWSVETQFGNAGTSMADFVWRYRY